MEKESSSNTKKVYNNEKLNSTHHGLTVATIMSKAKITVLSQTIIVRKVTVKRYRQFVIIVKIPDVTNFTSL